MDLGGGTHGLIEAAQPIAIEGEDGRHIPIDLGLSESGAAFEPKTPMVGVSIPKRLSDGVQIPALSLSLTPVDAQGAVLGGSEGALVGASVFYANTQTDTDTVVKPTTGGFADDTLLRSVESPDELYFRVGLPEGASLVQRYGAPNLLSRCGTPIPSRLQAKAMMCDTLPSAGEGLWPLARFSFGCPVSCRYVF